MGDKVKVGIIGMGAIGAFHAKSYQTCCDVEVSAICDINADAVNAKGDEFGVKKRFEDYRKLLKTDIDAGSICVGNWLHHEVALAPFEAGKHVLLEKPMAMNADQAGEIVAAADKAGKKLQIGMVWRQNPAVAAMKEFIAAGTLGSVYHARAVWTRRRGIPGMGGWFTNKAYSGGGPLIDLGVHWLDLSMWLADQWSPTAVSAQTYAKFGPDMKKYTFVSMWAGPPKYDGVFDVEDYASGMVRFASGATLSFEISWAANAPEEMYVEILGDKGGARLTGDDDLKFYSQQHGRLTDVQPQFDPTVNPYDVQAGKFIAACRGLGEPAATGEQGLAVMKVIDGVYASSQANKEVAIQV